MSRKSSEHRAWADAVASAFRNRYQLLSDSQAGECTSPAELARRAKLSRSTISALLNNSEKGRPGPERILSMAPLLGVDVDELRAQARRILENRQRIAFSNGKVPPIVGPVDPHTMVLRWALSGAIPVRRSEIQDVEAEAFTNQWISCAFYLRPESRLDEVTRLDRENPLWAPFLYTTRAKLADLNRLGARLLVLSNWEFQMTPGFVLLDQDPGGRSSSSHVTEFSRIASRTSDKAAMDHLRERLISRVFLVPRGSLNEQRLKLLLDLLGIAWENALPGVEADLGGDPPFSVVLDSSGTRASLSHLAFNNFKGSRVVVGGAPQFWATSQERPSSIRALVQEDDLLRVCSPDSPYAEFGERLRLIRKLETYVIATLDGQLNEGELRTAAAYFQEVSRRLKEAWNRGEGRDRLVGALLSEYNNYGGPGIPLDLDKATDFIDRGMLITHCDKASTADFSRYQPM